MVALGVIGLIAVAISIFVMYKRNQRPEVQMSKIGMLIRPLKEHIQNEIQKLDIAIDVIKECQSQNQHINRMLELFNNVDTSNESNVLEQKIKGLSSEHFCEIRQSLVEKIPSPYCDNFPDNINYLETYADDLNSQREELINVEKSLLHEHLEQKQIIKYYEKYLPNKKDFPKKNRQKATLKIVGLAFLYVAIISALIFLCVLFSSGVAVKNAKKNYLIELQQELSSYAFVDMKTSDINMVIDSERSFGETKQYTVTRVYVICDDLESYYNECMQSNNSDDFDINMWKIYLSATYLNYTHEDKNGWTIDIDSDDTIELIVLSGDKEILTYKRVDGKHPTLTTNFK